MSARVVKLPRGQRLVPAEVLAGAYRGKAVEERTLLTHAAVVDADGWPVRALCRRVPVDSLVVDSVDPSDNVTCLVCVERARTVVYGV